LKDFLSLRLQLQLSAAILAGAIVPELFVTRRCALRQQWKQGLAIMN
jgi:hypothetical protein